MEPLMLSAAQFGDLLADPAAPDRVSAINGFGLVAVKVRSAAELDQLAVAGPAGGRSGPELPGANLPCVLVAIAEETLASRCQFADVILSGDGPDNPRALDSIARTVAANPVAATSFALLLRSAATSDASVMEGLIAESAVYSTLQGGAEFARWRMNRPIRSDDSAGDRVRASRHGDVLEVVLTRPDRRNALDAAMRDALIETLNIAVAEPALRVQISGQGPAFCAGGDLDEFGARSDPAVAHLIRLTRSIGWLVHVLSARTQVRLHGACMGSGIEIPAFAGSVIAAPDTVIGLPEVALGLIPGAGGTVSLPRRIGRHRTAYLGLSGTRIDAATALSWGLVDTIG
jgi:hypothetical protein